MFSTYISRIWWLKNDDSRILYFWQVLGSIQKFIIQLHALQCLFVRGSNKQQRSGRIIFKFHKRTDFFVFYDNQVLLGVISQCAPSPPPPSPTKKTFLFSSVWARREYTWILNWKESLLICFENCQGVPYSNRRSRNRMMNTFIKVNITPTCKRSFNPIRDILENKSTLLTHFYLMLGKK